MEEVSLQIFDVINLLYIYIYIYTFIGQNLLTIKHKVKRMVKFAKT